MDALKRKGIENAGSSIFKGTERFNAFFIFYHIDSGKIYPVAVRNWR